MYISESCDCYICIVLCSHHFLFNPIAPVSLIFSYLRYYVLYIYFKYQLNFQPLYLSIYFLYCWVLFFQEIYLILSDKCLWIIGEMQTHFHGFLNHNILQKFIISPSILSVTLNSSQIRFCCHLLSYMISGLCAFVHMIFFSKILALCVCLYQSCDDFCLCLYKDYTDLCSSAKYRNVGCNNILFYNLQINYTC